MALKFDTIKNPNYVATVVSLEPKDLYDVPGLDNLKGYSKFGMQALVPKDTPAGLHILFSTEVQLSHDFVAANNLYRDSTQNRVQAEKGYLEANRRVKAIKLRQNRSESLLLPLTSLSYMLKQKELAELQENDVFDSINGQEICRKYYVKEPKPQGNQPKARVRKVDEKVFPQHLDSENYFRNAERVPDSGHIIVTQKLHGTSVRYGNVPVVQEQSLLQRLFRRPAQTKHQFVVGSRRVVKSIDHETPETKNHYYAEDLWTTWAKDHNVADRIPKDHIVYGELVGWTPEGSPIQKGYTYDLQEGEAELYVYRVAVVTSDGHIVDYNHDQMQQWCNERGFKVVPKLLAGAHGLINVESFLERRYYEEWSKGEAHAFSTPLPLSDKKLVDEGVCVRYDGPLGAYILKAKSPSFLEHETKMLDAEAEDMEASA